MKILFAKFTKVDAMYYSLQNSHNRAMSLCYNLLTTKRLSKFIYCEVMLG